MHGAGVDRSQGVGDRAAGVVVAVDAQRHTDLCRLADDVAHPAGQHSAVGVAQNDNLRPRLGGSAYRFEGVGAVAAEAIEEVFTVDEDPLTLSTQVSHGIGDHVQVLAQGRAQGELDVPIMTLGDDARHRSS